MIKPKEWLKTADISDWMFDWSLQIERDKRRAHRQQQISEAQAIIEGADMDGLVPHVQFSGCALY